MALRFPLECDGVVRVRMLLFAWYVLGCVAGVGPGLAFGSMVRHGWAFLVLAIGSPWRRGMQCLRHLSIGVGFRVCVSFCSLGRRRPEISQHSLLDFANGFRRHGVPWSAATQTVLP